MLHPVSLPSAAAAIPATVAAAGPPEDPPGIRVVSHGLRVGPKCGLLVVTPKASSWVLSLPSSTAPTTRCSSQGDCLQDENLLPVPV